MLSFDPFALDRDIAQGARAARHFLRALRRDFPHAEGAHPLENVRWVSGKTTFDEVAKMPPDDPLREPLRRWIFALALLRIAREPILDAARAWHEESVRLEKPEPTVTSPRDLVARLLRERAPAKRQAWIDALASTAPRIARASKERDEVLVEIASRMGAYDPWALFLPVDRALLLELARELLVRTDDLAAQLFGAASEPSSFLELCLARDVRGSWPVRAPRFIETIFDRTPLVHGLSIDTGPMPETLGASSLVRSLARFGAAYARAAVPREAPFVLANDPHELHPLRRGALFGSLVADPVFLRRSLGFSRDEARDAGRILARTLLGALRLEAARSLAGSTAASTRDLEELYSRAFCAPWPPALAEVLPRDSFQAPTRLLAALLASSDREALIHRFDDDWFRNPHALRHLREEDGTLTPKAFDRDALLELPRRLSTSLEALAS